MGYSSPENKIKINGTFQYPSEYKGHESKRKKEIQMNEKESRIEQAIDVAEWTYEHLVKIREGKIKPTNANSLNIMQVISNLKWLKSEVV